MTAFLYEYLLGGTLGKLSVITTGSEWAVKKQFAVSAWSIGGILLNNSQKLFIITDLGMYA